MTDVPTEPDDRELQGLVPADLLDAEAQRLDSFFAALADDDPTWGRPSRCAGWSVRDVLGHLAFSEPYHHACLDGTVQAFLASVAERGATDLDSANALGIADHADRPPHEVLDTWRESNARTRRGYRDRGDGRVDTTVGDYPARWQALHVALELATHADDVDVPVPAAERAHRLDWRARVSRFALAEAKPAVAVRHDSDGTTRVREADLEVEVDDARLVEGVAARLDATSDLGAAARALLSATP